MRYLRLFGVFFKTSVQTDMEYRADFFSDAVLARSDRETIALGGHLSAAEKRWLRDALEEALAA